MLSAMCKLLPAVACLTCAGFARRVLHSPFTERPKTLAASGSAAGIHPTGRTGVESSVDPLESLSVLLLAFNLGSPLRRPLTSVRSRNCDSRVSGQLMSDGQKLEPDPLKMEVSASNQVQKSHRPVGVSRRQLCGAGAAAAATFGAPRAPASADVSPPRNITWQQVPGIGPDGRRYGFAILDNGVRVLIASEEGLRIGQMAVTVKCGALDDELEYEGLAHLAEHVTLATDPANLYPYIEEELGGDINAFTQERTTTFYATFEMPELASPPRKSTPEAELKAQDARVLSQASERFAALFVRARSTDPTKAAAVDIVRQEVVRVNEEMLDLIKGKGPSEALLERAALKARALPSSVWRRLARGDKETLRVDRLDEAEAISKALTRLRFKRYIPEATTVAVLTPVPLEQAVPLVGQAFGQIPLPPAWVQMSPAEVAFVSSPFEDARVLISPAIAIQREGKPTLGLTWDIKFNDLKEEALLKPLALIAHTLTSPHERSLAALLRARGLASLSIEVDPVVKCRTVGKADAWVVWQMDIRLAESAVSRWREAAALGVEAVARLAQSGVPERSIAEARTMASAAWQWTSGPLSAMELAIGMQNDLPAELSVTGSRTFLSQTRRLADFANEVLGEMAERFPIVTVWAPNIEPLGVQPGAVGPKLPKPFENIAKLVPLKLPNFDKTKSPAEGWAQCMQGKPTPLQLQAPTSNPWVPTSFEGVSDPMTSIAYRYKVGGFEGSGGLDSGLVTLQIPGCLDPSLENELTYGLGALKDVVCTGSEKAAPFATAILQLESPVPASATAKEAARAELWRTTLREANSELIEAAAAAGLKSEVSFNGRGMRIWVSGYAQRLPRFMLVFLGGILRHVAPDDRSRQLKVARRVATIYARAAKQGSELAPKGVEQEVLRATSEQIQVEMKRFFKSVVSARLLLAGNLEREVSERLSSSIRQELKPFLKPTSNPPVTSSVREELANWDNLLYRPSYDSPLSISVCQDPAITRVLDLCGGLG